MKKALALLLAIVMMLSVLAGCGAQQDSSAQTTAAPGDSTTAGDTTTAATSDNEEHENVTLTAWYYIEEGVSEGYEGWADKVHETYPWITIEFEELPYDSGPEKFTVACATNTTPDLYFDGFSRISPAVHGGLCADLTDLVTDYQDTFLGEQISGVVNGENHYIALQDGASYAIAVNMTLAEQLGVADMLPTDWTQWSYDDFLEICRAAKAADSTIYPTALWAGSRSSDACYYNLLVANGVALTNDDLTATAFNTGDNQAKALEVLNFLNTIMDEGLCPNGAATMVDEDLYEYWNSGRQLFRINAALSNATGMYNDQQTGTSIEFDFDFLAAPTATGDYTPNCVSWGTYGVCVFKNNGHEDAAKLALGVLLENPEYMNTIVQITGKSSLLTNTSISYATEALDALMARATDYSANYADSSFGILESWWTDFRETFYVQLQDFYVGNIDAQTLLDNWQASGDTVLTNAAK